MVGMAFAYMHVPVTVKESFAFMGRDQMNDHY